MEIAQMRELKKGIYEIGALDPTLRVFDIIMTADYGTSYNSYLVKGEKKTALIEACHSKFYDQYLDHIRAICDPKDIDTIVLNHNEPDHTGAMARLLLEVGDATVYTTQSGALFIKAITNDPKIKIQIVRDGDILDLGGKTLQFVTAPFLHWPDSMFTYIKEDEVVFTCDFLGSHYCEPYLYDHKIQDTNAFDHAFKNYYTAIFDPFKPYVLKGLLKLDALTFDMVLPSHGPVLTKGENGQLDQALANYLAWSTIIPREKKCIPIFYTSAYGHTQALAESLAQGVRETVDAEVVTYDIIKHDMAELAHIINHCDGFGIGSPTINRDAVKPVWDLINTIDAINCGKRPFVAFGSYGWSGEGVANLTQRLVGLKCKPIDAGFRNIFTPTEDDLSAIKLLGVALATAVIN